MRQMLDPMTMATNRRFARNLALSLTGGAALLVLGATAAQAQEASTDSDGSGTTGTGDATAVGNRSGTSTDQTLSTSGSSGAPQVITQTAVVPNAGVAVADTGNNRAVGNQTNNFNEITQNAAGGDVATSNSGDASNVSDGAAWITTGDATSVGNESTTTIEQLAHGSNGLTIIDQTAVVANVGQANASTGSNLAAGNASVNSAGLTQNALANGIATNSAQTTNQSNGRASVTSGDANATGNKSTTGLAQSAGGSGDDGVGGLVIIGQGALVLNAGTAEASTGANEPAGNVSVSTVTAEDQIASSNNPATTLGIASNQADLTADSDGTASIDTGDATAVGNEANTNVTQVAHGEPSALGGIVSVQAAAVVNVGAAAARTGNNVAFGNQSSSSSDFGQNAEISAASPPAVDTPIGTASNSGSALLQRDGTATIETGDATARGNVSQTTLDQEASADVAGAGVAVNIQAAGVVNAGAARAETGENFANGNASQAVVDVDFAIDQDATVGVGALGSIEAPIVTASNTAEANVDSNGSASIRTGDATATGNQSDTTLGQSYDGSLDGSGVLLNVQAAGVANLGVAAADTGDNFAFGNISAATTVADQTASASSPNLVPGTDLEAAGPLTVSNSLSGSISSDGDASIDTGDATATGNRSATHLHQDATATLGADGLGVVPNLQVAGVLNAGAGFANTGENTATGNTSGRLIGLDTATITQTAAVSGPFDVTGPVTVSNAGEVAISSDGKATVRTGDATAVGNSSVTELSQEANLDVDGMGLVIAPQIGAVVNVGAALADTGDNTATGNESTNLATATQDASATAPVATDVIGPLTVSNSGAATSSSDGEACVCTGDASATGNLSNSTLTQQIDVSLEDGIAVVPTFGLILNAGLGVAETGDNDATGNSSTNTATSDQTSTYDPAAGPLLVGPQTFATSGGADNASDGLAEIGTGRATATGNDATSDLVQSASVDGGGAIATITGTIFNAGAGLANTGDNDATGNNSTNIAALTQTASGAGTVSSSGRASNQSDGTAQIGDPNCEDDEHEAPGEPDQPGAPGGGLPRTGSEVEGQAALALMLLLTGGALTEVSRRRRRQLA